MKSSTLIFLFIFTLFIFGCAQKDDDDDDSLTTTTTGVTIPDVSFSCAAASVSRCDATPHTNKVIVAWFVEGTTDVSAIALGTLSCDGTTCSDTIDTWMNSSLANITTLSAASYTIVAYMDVSGDITAVTDLASNIGSDDATCTNTGGVAEVLSSTSTAITLGLCFNNP